jgi:hypothetical protein
LSQKVLDLDRYFSTTQAMKLVYQRKGIAHIQATGKKKTKKLGNVSTFVIHIVYICLTAASVRSKYSK